MGLFHKEDTGSQIVDAADSIALNISEGYGRFHYRENKNFCYYSRGSAKETLTAMQKAKSRGLITEDDFKLLDEKLSRYFRLIYGCIKSIGNTTSDED
jgi:four helix bundle protein